MSRLSQLMTVLFFANLGLHLFGEERRFVLMVMLYNETNEERIREYQYCFDINSNNKMISHMHVLYDTSKDNNENILRDYIEDNGATVTEITGRASFDYFFSIANNWYPNSYIIIANADIIFDDTLELLVDFDFANTFMGLTVYDKNKKGEWKLRTCHGRASTRSQDSWLFKAPITIPHSENILLGTWRCDDSIAFAAYKEKYRVINPCFSIKTYHIHDSKIRHYSIAKSDKNKKDTRPTPWTYLDGSRNKKGMKK